MLRPLCAVVLALVVGWTGASLVVGSSKATGAQDGTIARAGGGSSPAILVRAARGWERTHEAPRIPGLAPTDAIVLVPWPGSTSKVLVTFLPLADTSLLPRALIAALRDPLPTPAKLQVAGRSALAYRELPVGLRDTTMDVYAAPTTAGVVTVACVRRVTVVEEAAGCRSGVADITAPGSPLPAGDDAAFLHRLPKVAAGLRERRSVLRERLAAARRPGRQVAPAQGLAQAYMDALAALRPLAAGGPSTATVATVGRLGRHYSQLATATHERDAAEFAVARRAIRHDERRLRVQLQRFARVLRSEAGVTSRRRQAALRESAPR